MFQFWLHNLPGVGDRTIEKLLGRFGSPREVYSAGQGALEEVLGNARALSVLAFRKTFQLQCAYEEMLDKKIIFCTKEDENYPQRLKEITHPPYGLYCLGNLPENQRPAAAIIGARECSEYGRAMAEAFAGRLGGAGVSIVSGMARGIDGIGQKAALTKGGKTYAVLGCGVDVCYPASNRQLYEEITEKGGGILSVFPPGTQPLKQHFPERNRIVAGLSDLILVVEARQKSGTWITVDMALEQGKSVYAVPGRLTDRLNDGCNLLIRQGAGIALSPDDILAELVVIRNRNGGRKEETKKAAAHPLVAAPVRTKSAEKAAPKTGADMTKEAETKEEAAKTEGILRFLDYHPKSADEILESMEKAGIKISLPQLLNELINLCMERRAKQVTGNYFIRKE